MVWEHQRSDPQPVLITTLVVTSYQEYGSVTHSVIPIMFISVLSTQNSR